MNTAIKKRPYVAPTFSITVKLSEVTAQVVSNPPPAPI